MYHLKANVNIESFLQQIRFCQGEVFFKTADGDNLNLKSQLSHYVLMIVANNKDFLLKGIIECANDADYDLLSDFCTKI